MNQNTNNLKLEDIQEFMFERFDEVKFSKRMKDLVQFHTTNKYLLMAHSPNQLKKLGRIVANHEENEVEQVINEYWKEFTVTLSIRPTSKSHTNVLYHILGHFSKDLSKQLKEDIIKEITKFSNGNSSLNDILSLLREYTKDYEKYYLVQQTYFLFFTNKKL